MCGSGKCIFDQDTFKAPVTGQGVYFARYDLDGNAQWANGVYLADFGAVGSTSLAVDKEGSTYTTGGLDFTSLLANGSIVGTAYGNQENIFITKFDSSGHHAWTKVIGGDSFNQGRDVACDSLGNVYVTGVYNSYVTFGSQTLQSDGGQDVFVLKYDKNGNFQWVLSGAGSGNSGSTTIQVSPSGEEIYVGGYYSGELILGNNTFNSPTANSDFFLAKISQPTGVSSMPGTPVIASVYPNPGNGKVTIGLSNAAAAELSLTDLSGRVLYAEALPARSGLLSRDFSYLADGLYLLRAGNGPAQKLVIRH